MNVTWRKRSSRTVSHTVTEPSRCKAPSADKTLSDAHMAEPATSPSPSPRSLVFPLFLWRFLLRLPLSLSTALNAPHVHDAWCKGLSEAQNDFFLMDAKDSKVIGDVTVAFLSTTELVNRLDHISARARAH